MSVALWTSCHWSPDYELYDTEAEAARFAVLMEVDNLGEHGVALGVQYPDGRALGLRDWPAYREEADRHEAERKARAAAAAVALKLPPKPQRKIKDPFMGYALEIDAREPDWIGRPL